MSIVHKKKIGFLTIVPLLLIILFFFISPDLFMNTYSVKAAEKIETYTDTMGIGLNWEAWRVIHFSQDYKAKYTYKSSNPNIVSIDKYGTYKSHAAGSSIITVNIVKNKKEVKIAEIKVIVSRAKLNYKECLVSVGNTYDSVVKHIRYGATYTIKSSDPNIVTHTAYHDLLGVGPGNATVTVYENYMGTTRKLGTIKVKVVASKLTSKSMKISLCEIETAFHVIDITDINKSATYKFTVDNPKIIDLDKKQGIFWGIKHGKTKIHVSETYKSKTRKLGAITVEVVPAALVVKDKVLELTQYSTHYFENLFEIEFMASEATYYCKPQDSNIVTIDEYDQIAPINTGKTKLSIYENYKGVERLIGTQDVVVVPRDTTYKGIQFNQEAYEELSTFYLDPIDDGYDYYLPLDDYIDKINPYSTMPELFITSSNEKVLMIVDEEYLQPLAEGEADLMVSDGLTTIKLRMKVKIGTPEDLQLEDEEDE